MKAINNSEELKDQFRLITLLGKEVIPTHLELEWENYVNGYQKLDSNDVIEFLDQCNVIVKTLLKFKNNRSGKEIASEFYQTFRYKNNYSKGIANVITAFAPFPENVQFLQGYYESFLDITPEEESAITDKINNIKALNDIMNLGLSYESAKSLSRYPMIDVNINGETTTLMHWTNDIYCGVNEKNDLISYEQIGDDFDVIYIVKEDNTYIRLITRRPKLTPSGMLASKTLMTDQNNKVLGVENNEILVNPNFFDTKQKVDYYQKVSSRVDVTDSLTSLNITQEAIKLGDIVGEENHTLCSDIFNKMIKEAPTKDPQTK